MNTTPTNNSINSILGLLRQMPLTPSDKRWLASKLNEDASLEDAQAITGEEDEKPVYRLRSISELSPLVQGLVGIIPWDSNGAEAQQVEEKEGRCLIAGC